MAKQSFKDLISGPVPVLVDFYADWCGPCKTMAPELQKAAADLGDKVRVIKIDVDKNQELAGKENIRSIPTLVLFKNGKSVVRQSGALSAAQIKRLIAPHL